MSPRGVSLTRFLVALCFTLLALAQLTPVAQAVPVAQDVPVAQAVPVAPAAAEVAQPQEFSVEGLAFTDWLQQVAAKLKHVLEKTKGKAEDLIEETKTIAEDAWNKIKEIQAAKKRWVAVILPGYLKLIKYFALVGLASVDSAIRDLVGLLKKVGAEALEEALAAIENLKPDVGGKEILDKLVSQIKSAIKDITGIEAYASQQTDELKLILIKLTSSVADVDAGISADVAVLVSELFGLQTALNILQIMKIENPAAASILTIFGLRLTTEAEVGLRKTIFEEILERIIAQAQKDPVKVGNLIVTAFKPLGKAALKEMLKNLKKFQVESPSEALEIIIDIVQAAVDGKAEKYSVFDWLKGIGETIDRVIQEAKAKGQDIVGALGEVAEEALEKIIEAASTLKEVEKRFLDEVLPTLIAKIKALANKTSEAADKVSDMLVSMLRRLGARAIRAALDYVDDHEADIGERLHDFLLQRLQDALAEISYVQEFGLQSLITALNQGRS